MQALPSLQLTVAWVQPVLGLHPSDVHALPSLQFGGGPPVHAPAWHVSLCVHALLSLHAVPFDTAVFTQYRDRLKKLYRQVSEVHALLSLHQ
mgnify:CR=1 FL=1